MARKNDVAEIVHETRSILSVVLKILRTVLIIISITAAVAAAVFAVYKFVERKKVSGYLDDDEFDFDDEMLADE